MSVTTTTLTPVALIAAGTACVPGTPQRATRSLMTRHGGLLNTKITNGATGPTAQCVCTVYTAHAASLPATPAAASPGEGADWKTHAVVMGGGTAANAITPSGSVVIPPMCHMMVEFAGNTGQNVTVEAFFTEYTNLDTV